jgi:hypothetical protein
MIRDDTRAFLDSLQECRAEVQLCRDRIRELENAATRITTAWKEAPGGGGDVHKDDVMIALADQRQKLLDREKECGRRMTEISAFIDRVEGFTYRTILSLRYVDGLSWPEVTAHLESWGVWYSERHVTRLHGQALAAARRLWAREHKEGKE